MKQNESIATSTPEVPEVKVPFNPFVVLTVEQITELLGKFPKQWRESRTIALSNAQTEHGISDADAIFLVWLQDEANSRIVAKKVSEVATRIINLAGAVGGTQSVAALDMIKVAYEELQPANRADAGIKVRDAVKKNMVTAIADEKLNLIYKHLGVTEKQWMRK